MPKLIYVSISLQNKTFLVGKLWIHSKNGRESASFEYDKDWLNNPESFALEPALKLLEGAVHTPENRIYCRFRSRSLWSCIDEVR